MQLAYQVRGTCPEAEGRERAGMGRNIRDPHEMQTGAEGGGAGVVDMVGAVFPFA